MSAASIVPVLARPRAHRRVVVLTGAGISASAGLSTYRGPGGLWEARPELAAALRAGVSIHRLWEALGPMRRSLQGIEPTAAHRALAAFEDHLEALGGALTVITQNVDGLHQRAGSRAVIEYHGALRRSRCADRRCDLPAFVDDTVPEVAPLCPRCGDFIRPDVVLFDEAIGVREEIAAKRALQACDLFIAVGTSGMVWPAASFVREAEYAGAATIDVNLVGIADSPYEETILGAADEVLPALLAG